MPDPPVPSNETLPVLVELSRYSPAEAQFSEEERGGVRAEGRKEPERRGAAQPSTNTAIRVLRSRMLYTA
jgi:hypothetical protein